jgi:hypothetical protein
MPSLEDLKGRFWLQGVFAGIGLVNKRRCAWLLLLYYS